MAETVLPEALGDRSVTVTGGNITTESAGILGLQLSSSDQSLNISLSFRSIKAHLTAIISDGDETEFTTTLNEVRSSMRILLVPHGDSYELSTTDCHVSIAKPTGYAAREQLEETDHYHIASEVIRHKWCSSQSQERVARSIRLFLNPGKLQLPQYFIDLSLMAPTVIHESDLELTYRGSLALWANSNITLSNPNPLPPIPAGLNVDDTSIDLQLSDFALNLAVRRLLEKENVQVVLKRNGSIPLTPEIALLFDKLEQSYPDRKIELYSSPKSFPKFWIAPAKVFVEVPMNVLLIATELTPFEVRPAPTIVVLVIAEETCNFTFKAEPLKLGIQLEELLKTAEVSCIANNVVTSLKNSTRADFLFQLQNLSQIGPKKWFETLATGLNGRNLPKVILQEGAAVIHANANSICFSKGFWDCSA